MKQLAITGNNRIEIIEYEVRPLGPHEVLVRTEIASGKHGTASAILDGSNSVGVRFDQEMRLFVNDPGAKGSFPTREHPWNLGTSGVGVIEQVGSEVSRWKIGDRVFGSRLITPILTLEESVGIFDTIKNRPEEVIKFAVRF